jgi:uncharacterized protein
LLFWDASAIAPLLVDEPHSRELLDLLGDDQAMVVWWVTRVECVSAIRRRERDGGLDRSSASGALELLNSLSGSWSEVLPSERVRESAERAVAVHPLRAADSLQLAAALTWRDAAQRPGFVCLDERLSDAASREGLAVLPA